MDTEEDLEVSHPSPPMTATEKLNQTVTRLLWLGILGVQVLTVLGMVVPSASNAVAFIYMCIGFGLAWFVLALAWVFLRLFPSILFSLRALFLGLVALQIPLILFAIASTLLEIQVAVGLVFVWMAGALMYLFFIAKRVEEPK